MKKKKRGYAPVVISLHVHERGMLRRAISCKLRKLKRLPVSGGVKKDIAYCESLLRKVGAVCKCCGQVVD